MGLGQEDRDLMTQEIIGKYRWGRVEEEDIGQGPSVERGRREEAMMERGGRDLRG